MTCIYFHDVHSDILSYRPVNAFCFFAVKKSGEAIDENQLHDILSEVDLNKNGQVDLGEYLQV